MRNTIAIKWLYLTTNTMVSGVKGSKWGQYINTTFSIGGVAHPDYPKVFLYGLTTRETKTRNMQHAKYNNNTMGGGEL